MTSMHWMRRLGVMRCGSIIATACALSACSSAREGSESRGGARQEIDPAGAVAVSTHSNLQWKRYGAFEADLAAALELAPDALCSEFGKESCIRAVHLVPLGGHEPFDTGMLAAAPEPLATTPTVVDRIVLSACGNRVDLDLAAGAEAKVFKHFPLSGAAPAPASEAAHALVNDLYRRLLGRNGSEGEVETVAGLALGADGQPAPAAQFARLACFTIGGSAEFLFF
jgi:hypothetical protein